MPPGEREADRVERQVDFQRELRTTGEGDRFAEAARDQIAAAGADRADEAERSTALDAGGLQGERPAGFAGAPGLAKVLLAEDRRNHPVGRSVADTGGDEEDEDYEDDEEEEEEDDDLDDDEEEEDDEELNLI